MKKRVAVNMSIPTGGAVIRPSSWSSTISRPPIEIIAATMSSLKKPLKIPRLSSLKMKNIRTVKSIVSPRDIKARVYSMTELTG